MPKKYRLIMSFILVFSFIPNFVISAEFLFNGSGLPEDHGWLSYSNGILGSLTAPLPIIVPQTGGGNDDLFYASTSGNTFNEYMIDSGAGSFYVSIRVAIEEASHGYSSAGFAFSPNGCSYPYTDTGVVNWSWTHGSFGLYLDADQIGFLGLSDVYYLNATEFHEYAILYAHNLMKVYIDNSYQEIIDGIATPVFSREIPPIHPSYIAEWKNILEGAIVFGDTSNGLNVNSSYTIDFIKFEYLGPRIFPRQGTAGSVFTITGRGFGSEKGQVFIGENSCTILTWSDKFIEFILYDINGLNATTYDVTVQPEGESPVVLEQAFTLMVPAGRGIYPQDGYSGNFVTIQGWFFGEKNIVEGKVFLGENECQILRWTNEEEFWDGKSYIVFIVPNLSSPGFHDLVVSNKFGSEIIGTFNAMMSPSRWYVDGENTASGNGTSWAEAFRTIQEAVDAASANDELWVKRGTYRVSSEISVQKSVAIYGGFDGSETQQAERNWSENQTVVDGQGTNRCFFLKADSTLDGLTISNGSTAYGGGGIFISSSSPLVTNCIFRNNQAGSNGGGAIHSWNASPNITNSIFAGNDGGSNGGGAIFSWDCPSGRITNCTFSENNGGSSGGGAIYNYNSGGLIENSILWNNSSHIGSEIYNEGGELLIQLTDIAGGIEGIINASGGMVNDNGGNFNLDPMFAESYHLQAISPCIDAQHYSAPQSYPVFDLDHNPRIINTAIDIGAYEFGDVCTGDFVPTDGDVDGVDLARLASIPALLDLSIFADDFGKNGCQ